MKINRTEHIDMLKKLICKYSSSIPLNEICMINNHKLNTNSWFELHENKSYQNKDLNIPEHAIDKSEKIINCKKVILRPNKYQKQILLKWMHSCRIMYNYTIKYFKNARFKKEKYSTNFKKIRTYILKNDKKRLIKKYGTPSHMLDGSIKLACSMFKSMLTNLKNGNISYFRLRYLKKNKKSLVMPIEQAYLRKKSICPSKLNQNKNDILRNNDDLEYNTIKNDCMLHFSRSTNRFTLLVPQNNDIVNKKDKKKYIAIDPGVRTFMTCLTNKNTVEIGKNVQTTLKKLIKKIDIIPNKKKTRKISMRIQNKITDLHWKTINYLLQYKNIMIGNWSTKGCSQGKINKTLKRIMLRLRYHDFLNKLIYKCKLNNVNLKIVDESYSSKICSNCGNEHKNLGGLKIYDCSNCKIKLDRDINGCRNILMKSFNKRFIRN